MDSDFLYEAEARGFIFQCTDIDGLRNAMRAAPIAGYIGFDCTADSLHVGHMMQIMMLRLLQRYGHKPVVILGGGTTRVGDPSFRQEARLLLTPEQIATNMAGIKRSIEGFLKFGEEPSDAILVDNAEWLLPLSYIDLLREVGVHFSVNRMLAFDSVRSRLEREQGLTFLEFNYSILQAYDFREVYRRYGVTLQMGGSDQWGNIVQGIELLRRTDGRQGFGLTAPLITTASGAKMGKSAAGAVWLSEKKLPVFDYWQFWRNTEDEDVGRFLRLFTDLPLAEISRLSVLHGAELNEAKKILAFEATALCHGRKAADMAAQTGRRIFEEGLRSDQLPGIDLPTAELKAGIPAFALFVRAGLVSTNSEARRLIREGGARINDTLVTGETALFYDDAAIDGVIKLSKGRKQHRLVRIT